MGQVYCPECEAVFTLDDSHDGLRRELDEARCARLRRKAKLRELRQRWSDPPPTEAEIAAAEFPRRLAEHPMRISDVLRNLDALLVRLNAERNSGRNDRAA